jgi:hypothetical protein
MGVSKHRADTFSVVVGWYRTWMKLTHTFESEAAFRFWLLVARVLARLRLVRGEVSEEVTRDVLRGGKVVSTEVVDAKWGDL